MGYEMLFSPITIKRKLSSNGEIGDFFKSSRKSMEVAIEATPSWYWLYDHLENAERTLKKIARFSERDAPGGICHLVEHFEAAQRRLSGACLFLSKPGGAKIRVVDSGWEREGLL